MSTYRRASSGAVSRPPPGLNQSVIAWIMPSRARPVSVGEVTSNTPAATPREIVSDSICSTRRRWRL
jgi:hypothetical protein